MALPPSLALICEIILKTHLRWITFLLLSFVFHGALLSIHLRADGSVLSGQRFVVGLAARSPDIFLPERGIFEKPLPEVAPPPAVLARAVPEPAVKPVALQSRPEPALQPQEDAMEKSEPQPLFVARSRVSAASTPQATGVLTAARKPLDESASGHAGDSIGKGNPVATPAVPPAVSGAIPRYADNPPPNYPDVARRKGWSGEVRLLVGVDASGDVEHLSVQRSSGYPVLDRAARQAVRLWRFVPARNGGLQVASEVVVPVDFRLPDVKDPRPLVYSASEK